MASDKPLPAPARGTLSWEVKAFNLKHTLRTETLRWTRAESPHWESVRVGDFIWEEFMKQMKVEYDLEEEGRAWLGTGYLSCWRLPHLPGSEPSGPWLVLFGASCESHAFHSKQRTWGGHQRRDSRRRPWRLSPVRKGKRNYRLCPSLQELITQEDQLFPIISEDRTRGNRPKGLRFKFRYLQGFPSSVWSRGLEILGRV